MIECYFYSREACFYLTMIGCYFYSREAYFYIPAILKTAEPGRHQAPLTFDEFSSNKKFYLVDCLDKYSRRTFVLRKSQPYKPKQLLISYAQPLINKSLQPR